MQAVSALTSSVSTAGNMADPQLVAAELAVRLDVDDPVRAQRLGHRGGVDRFVEVHGADDQRALGRVGDERRRVLRRLRPRVEVRRGGGRALDAAVEAAEPEHPLELVGEQHQRGDRRRVVGLVLERVVQRGREREELRDPAAAGRDLADPLLRRRAHQREPQPAVGGEALLRREVVDVGVLRVHRAGRRRPTWRRSGPARRRRARRRPSRRSRSRCAPTRRRRPTGRRSARARRPGRP